MSRQKIEWGAGLMFFEAIAALMFLVVVEIILVTSDNERFSRMYFFPRGWPALSAAFVVVVLGVFFHNWTLRFWTWEKDTWQTVGTWVTGIALAFFAAKTLEVYQRQAKIMEDQKKTLDEQTTLVRNQSGISKLQADIMDRQATIQDRQLDQQEQVNKLLYGISGVVWSLENLPILTIKSYRPHISWRVRFLNYRTRYIMLERIEVNIIVGKREPGIPVIPRVILSQHLSEERHPPTVDGGEISRPLLISSSKMLAPDEALDTAIIIDDIETIVQLERVPKWRTVRMEVIAIFTSPDRTISVPVSIRSPFFSVSGLRKDGASPEPPKERSFREEAPYTIDIE